LLKITLKICTIFYKHWEWLTTLILRPFNSETIRQAVGWGSVSVLANWWREFYVALPGTKSQSSKSLSLPLLHDWHGKITEVEFYVLLTVHLVAALGKWPTWCIITLYNTCIIIILYMFRATLCSSPGGQIVLIQHPV